MKRIKECIKNPRNIIVITLIMICVFLSIPFFINITENNTINYNNISEDKCSIENRSNNAWINCEQNYLEEVKIEKKKHFKQIEDLFKTDKQNVVLVNETDSNKDFMDWYINSNNNNHIACVAEVYWTKAGSAYEGNLADCEIGKTFEDIKMIDELYSNFREQDY